MNMTHNPNLMQTSLKRNKHSYQSTALHSMKQTRTIPKQYYRQQNFKSLPNQFIKLPFYTKKQQQSNEESKKQVRSMIQKIATIISQEGNKCRRQVNSKSMRHFYYRGISRTVNYPILGTPKIVFELSERAHIRRTKSSSPPISYTYGFLEQANCVYYAVQNKIVFVRIQDIISRQDSSESSEIPFVIYEVRNQVINVFQIVGSNIMFPNHDLIIAVVHPWQIQFYAWEPGNVHTRIFIGEQIYQNTRQSKQMGLVSLNFIYTLPIEKLQHIDYSSDGRIFFFDEEGALHQIAPHQQKLFLLYKTGKYSIRNYINTSHNTFQILSTKHGKFAPLFNLASNIAQASKYLFPSHITTKKIFCDRNKNYLFGLLQKKTQLPFAFQNQLFIVCYDIKQKSKLIHKFSQQYFIEKYGSHVHSQKPKQFKIQSIFPAPEFYENANISIISKSGIKIIMQILPGDAVIVEIIRPPDQRMFDVQVKLAANQNRYPPKQKSVYQVQSYFQDQQKTIYALTREKGILNTYITASSVLLGAIDISQQATNINLQIFKQGSWKNKIFKINERRLFTYLNQGRSNLKTKYISELSGQTVIPPNFYLFQGDLKTQVMSYIRPIDILFTAFSLMILQSHTFNRLIEKSLTKQKLLMKIFLSQSFTHSLVGNSEISIQELCSMIMQILIDKDGIYFYSSDAAGQIVQIWQSYQNNSKQSQSSMSKIRNFQNIYDFNQSENFNNANNTKRRHATHLSSHLKIGANQIINYKKISQKLIIQAKQILQKLTFYGPDLLNKFLSQSKERVNNQIFYDFSDTPFTQLKQSTVQKVKKQQIIQFKLNTLIKYLSRIILHVWSIDINQIRSSLRLFLISKLQHLYSYLKSSQNELKIPNVQNLVHRYHINIQYDQLLLAVSRMIQLFHLIDNVPVFSLKKTFGQCLSQKLSLFQQAMFKIIHRQYRVFIINKWKNLFPVFISQQFITILRLYQEIQEMPNKQNIIKQLKDQTIILKYPDYFLDYLTKVRNFSSEQIKQILQNTKKTRKIDQSQRQADDFNFQMPIKLIQIASKYNKQSGEISKSDLQYIENLLTVKNQQQKLTITNKMSIIAYLKAHLPKNRRIQIWSKYLSVQYELYRYYLRQITKMDKQKNRNKWKIFDKICNKKNIKQIKQLQDYNTQYNALTMQLLRFQSIMGYDDKLQKLITTTADYWLMSDYYTTFQDIQNLKKILKDICNDFSSNTNRKYSSFSAYIQRYLLNIAIKSQHSKKILQLVCLIIDQYLIGQSSIKNTISNWISFDRSLTSISDKVIWFPQLLIKLGYNPKQIFDIELRQMENIFQKQLHIQNQFQYCLKMLNCYMLVDKYVKNQRKQFSKIVNLQLEALQKVENISNKSVLGIRKMLDQLVSKSL